MTTQPHDFFASSAPPRSASWRTPPGRALRAAFDDTVRLLFRPFDSRRWIKLSLVCLFLGGGTPTAAFHWSLSTLPADIHISEWAVRARVYFAQHLGLTLLAIVLGLAAGVAWLYLRAVFRFVLVDCLLRPQVSLREAWQAGRPLGRSYFLWLLTLLLVLGGGFASVAVVAAPHLRAASAEGTHTLALSTLLVAALILVGLVGSLVVVTIALTDDLVVPMMYAGRFSLLTAWRRLGELMRAETTAFLTYILVRFAVSVGVGAAVLLFLFTALVSVFSGAIIAAALMVLGLHLVGIGWAWNPVTILVAIAGFGLLTLVLFILLSVAGMPGQAFLQSFGIRFIAAREPGLGLLRHLPAQTRPQ